MAMTRFQKLATAALVSVLFLIFVGAMVRVSGSGMGCPDWPTCWGCLIPPTSADQVDFDKLPIEKFQRKAERMGRDPSTISADSLRAEFNPRHVWTEFINRLCSLPVGFFTLATFIAAFWQRSKRPLVFFMAFASLAVVLINAWMGARVVYSGLKPGVLTTHLALAMSLTGMLAYCVWRGCEQPWRVKMSDPARARLRLLLTLLIGCVIFTGIIGAQVRELTDAMSKFHHNAPRSEWIGELEQSWKYLLHRSFSWVIFGLSVNILIHCKRHGTIGKVGAAALFIILTQMILGIIMSQIHIYSWVQVLHVGLSAILLSLLWIWWYATRKNPCAKQG